MQINVHSVLHDIDGYEAENILALRHFMNLKQKRCPLSEINGCYIDPNAFATHKSSSVKCLRYNLIFMIECLN